MPRLSEDSHPSRITKLLENEYPFLENLYREFHSHPELSGQEKWTSSRLASELETTGYTVTKGIGGFGVVAVMQNGEGPVLMLRAYMDALPVREETGLPYASTIKMNDNQGRTVDVMHACGHDLHMTALVGAARVMEAIRDMWKGTIVLIGQPSEEMVSGAACMVKDGLYSRFPQPNAAISFHVAPELPSGTIGYREDIISAGSESLDIIVHGIGGHAAHPERTKDPVVIAAQIILAYQTIISREIPSDEMAVLTVASVHGGLKHNAIPDEIELQVNIRYFHQSVRDQLLNAIERVGNGIARSAGLPADLLPTIILLPESVPPIRNDPLITSRVVTAFRRVYSPDQVRYIEPSSGSEDFGIFGAVEPPIPICYFRVGCGEGSCGFLHSSRFAPDPKIIIIASRLLVIAALELLSQEN